MDTEALGRRALKGLLALIAIVILGFGLYLWGAMT